MATRSQERIQLLANPTYAPDSQGRLWKIDSIHIEREGYIPDVYVTLGQSMADAWLADDGAFVGAVMKILARKGYEGPSFDRAELGMQSDRCVVLEPGRAFAAFAASKGFVDLDKSPEEREALIASHRSRATKATPIP
jgi:hypothetical protein